jgi:ClpP class serine protease
MLPMMGGKKKKKKKATGDRAQLLEAINEATTREIEAEEEFLTTVSEVLPDENARARFVRLATQRSSLRTSLTEAFALEENAPAPLSQARAFVIKFDGDVTASQVGDLREEVTAVLCYANATRGDEVVVRLNSGGGTVTGYGLAAAQLLRLKTSGLRLVICVEQVAASGGYYYRCRSAGLFQLLPFKILVRRFAKMFSRTTEIIIHDIIFWSSC